MGHLATVATCALRQWALDFEGNLERVLESIRIAKAQGARLRVGSELELCGYACADHFLEQDLYLGCWEMLERILTNPECNDILLDIGMPVLHRNVRYNCRVLCLNGKILLIRPKAWLAGDSNYFEMRYFTPWLRPREWDDFHLPRRIQKLQGATHVIFGDVVISTPDTCIGVETCEELFTPDAPHIQMALDGVEIFTNSSGSHFTLRKLSTRMQLIQEATRKNGGVYLYANQSGCGGDRLYFDASAMVLLNGDVVAQGSQFSLRDVEVVVATVDLEEVRAYRSPVSRALQAACSRAKYHRVQVDFELSTDGDGAGGYDLARAPSVPAEPRYHSPEEEIALCCGAYLWDYLRRSRMSGYLVPLSGGIDSCATAVLVFCMCRMVVREMAEGNAQVAADVRRIAKYADEPPRTAKELCSQIFHTIYMGMRKQSSKETRGRARDLAEAIGAYHVNCDIDEVFEAQKNLVTQSLGGFVPRFRVEGGSVPENLTLQNIQARSRMVTAYTMAQLLPTTRKRPGGGALLVLGSANVGESLRGYLTKYDCSSADINPIGSIDKSDLKRLIRWAKAEFGIPCLQEFLDAVPTAELEPITETYVQSDEADMGMTYDELTVFGRLRKESRLGPYGMFQRLVHEWSADRPAREGDEAPRLEPRQVAEKVKRFFHYYAVNRHKMTTITPAIHANDYSPDDNRFDMRPFLYPPMYGSWPFKRIDEELEKMEKARAASK